MAGIAGSKEYVSASYIFECASESGGSCDEDGSDCCPFGSCEDEGGGGCDTGGPCVDGCCVDPDHPDITGSAGFYCNNGICTASDDMQKSCVFDEGTAFSTSLGNQTVAHLGECGELETEEGGSGERPDDWRCGAPMEPGTDCPSIGGKYIAPESESRIPPTQLSFAHFASWTGSPAGEKMIMTFKDERLEACSTNAEKKVPEGAPDSNEFGGFLTEDGKPQTFLIGRQRRWEVSQHSMQQGDIDASLQGRTAVVINPPTRAMPVPGQPTCGLHKYSKSWENSSADEADGEGEEPCGEDDPMCCKGYEVSDYDKILEYQDTQGSIFEAWGGYGVEIPSVYGTKNNNVVIRPPLGGGDKVKPKKHSG